MLILKTLYREGGGKRLVGREGVSQFGANNHSYYYHILVYIYINNWFPQVRARLDGRAKV